MIDANQAWAPQTAPERIAALAEFGPLWIEEPKWGGFSGCREVARRADASGAIYCPHWLGGPIGLVASMHLRAAVGDAGTVEWDANPNPVHERLQPQLPAVRGGRIALGDAPCLGLALRIADFADLVTWQGAVG